VFAAIAMRDEHRGSWLQQLSVVRRHRSHHQGQTARSRGAAEAAYVERLSRDETTS
jgi:hypothetical protein